MHQLELDPGIDIDVQERFRGRVGQRDFSESHLELEKRSRAQSAAQTARILRAPQRITSHVLSVKPARAADAAWSSKDASPS